MIALLSKVHPVQTPWSLPKLLKKNLKFLKKSNFDVHRFKFIVHFIVTRLPQGGSMQFQIQDFHKIVVR